jgi:hypothetical protein
MIFAKIVEFEHEGETCQGLAQFCSTDEDTDTPYGIRISTLHSDILLEASFWFYTEEERNDAFETKTTDEVIEKQARGFIEYIDSVVLLNDEPDCERCDGSCKGEEE